MIGQNKYKWEYRYVTELIGGGYVDHIVVVTDLGKEVADLLYEKAIDRWCKNFNKEVSYFMFKGKERNK
jgi:hypothetical protein